MHAIILAAGLGTRMRPLTDNLPKPLLRAGGRTLLEFHLESLARAGVRNVVINHSRNGHLIESFAGTGERWGLTVTYSAEGPAPLETGGGIRRALPLLGEAPFIVVNADVWTDLDFTALPRGLRGLAHLLLVPNPSHHPDGDFALDEGRVTASGPDRLTYSGIGVLHPRLFRGAPEGAFPLAPLLREAMDRDAVTGELFRGRWFDVGTPERLAALDSLLAPDGPAS